MSTHIGIGFSQNVDIEKAAKDAAFQSKTNLQADRIDFALVLSTIHYSPHKINPVINKVLNQTRIMGCSTAGIILSDSIKTRGIAVLTITSDEIKFGLASVENLNTRDGQEAGILLARECLFNFGKHSRNAFIFLFDGDSKNTSSFLKGIQSVYGNVFPIIGAGSCDDFHFRNTFQMFYNKIMQFSAVGLLLGGHTNIGVGGRHGWRPLGKPRTIDKVDDNLIISINGKTAVSIYDEYFGREAENLRSTQLNQMAILYPLGIYVEGSDEYLLKNAVDIMQDGSILCQGDIPEGSEVHIMIGNKESCKLAAAEAALEAQKNLLGKQPKLIIILESMARLKLLGRAAFSEIRKIKEIFGADVPIIGMYSNGEVSPFQSVERFKKPHFQNESIVILAIS